ncbi:unnamed protein product [Vitrella brassicaformis CCMP3155]|uniref:Uncharacterized protein n=1 Tax=Vitrella brassicaformis (strain CCMP3155) TaxID=1169540 RepID=A0A0G4G4U7_VITBC|nr:unnamed protein product [Vitrella brassicaformis CCMP3155]|eukprot:CEM23124.1 unnamed protein product [Vitrella brassicaformis CCMP3155]
MTLRRLSIGPYIPNVARVVPEDVRLLKVSKKNPNPAKDGLMPPSKKHKGSYGEPKYMSKYLKDSKTAVSWLKVPAEPITVPAKMEDHVAFSLSVDTLDTRREGMKDEADFFRSFPKGMFEVRLHSLTGDAPSRGPAGSRCLSPLRVLSIPAERE